MLYGANWTKSALIYTRPASPYKMFVLCLLHSFYVEVGYETNKITIVEEKKAIVSSLSEQTLSSHLVPKP
jgi:hypothetical protein